VLTHCTVARSGAATGLQQAGGTLNVINSIVFGNNSGGVQIGGTATVDYSCVQGGYTGMGNVPFDPAFAGPGCDHHQLSIVLGSPAIDGGNPTSPADACFPPSFGSGSNSRADMGHNGGPLACHWYGQSLTSTPASPALTPVGAGGAQLLELNPGAEFQGDFYFLLGSVSGFAPGFPLDGLHVPLQPADPYFDLTAAGSTAIPLTGGFGTLGPVGAAHQATAQFTIPAGVYPPVLSGVRVYHSFLVIRVTPTLIELVFASNPVEAHL
jgi:hypothetical protein